MTLSLRGDIYQSSASCTFFAACASGTNLYTVTNEPKLRTYNIGATQLKNANTQTLTGSNPAGVTFIAPASIVVAYQGSSRFDLYDANTFATLGITTNAAATKKVSTQQIAGLPALNLALATNGNTTGHITMVGLSCAAQIVPAVLSGQSAQCVISRFDTNTWLLGTSDGKIHEINSSGTILTTVDLVSAPAVSAPTITVSALAYYNGYVVAGTETETFVYSWPGGVLQTAQLAGNNTSGSVMSNAVSGIVLIAGQNGVNNNYNPVGELYFDNGNYSLDSTFMNENNVAMLDLGIEPTNPYAWAIFNTPNAPTQFRIFNITPPGKELVSTLAQNPIGNNVACRIIRFRRANGLGSAVVEVDQNIFPGPANLSCSASRNYMELCLLGNVVNGNPPYTVWDIREFQS